MIEPTIGNKSPECSEFAPYLRLSAFCLRVTQPCHVVPIPTVLNLTSDTGTMDLSMMGNAYEPQQTLPPFRVYPLGNLVIIIADDFYTRRESEERRNWETGGEGTPDFFKRTQSSQRATGLLALWFLGRKDAESLWWVCVSQCSFWEAEARVTSHTKAHRRSMRTSRCPASDGVVRPHKRATGTWVGILGIQLPADSVAL